MDAAIKLIQEQPTFEHEGRQWVLFERLSFQPIVGVVEAERQHWFMSRTKVVVMGLEPDLSEGRTAGERRHAAMLDIARVMLACGDIIGWHVRPREKPEVIVTFADDDGARRARMQDRLELPNGFLSVRPRVFPLESTAVCRVEPDAPLSFRKPAAWFDADIIKARVADSPKTPPKLQSFPAMLEIPCQPFHPDLYNGVTPARWGFPAPKTVASAATKQSLSPDALEPIVSTEYGLPFRPTGVYRFNSMDDFNRANQWTLDHCQVLLDRAPPRVPRPTLNPRPDANFPVYEKPAAVRVAQGVRDLKLLAKSLGARDSQLKWGPGYFGENIQYPSGSPRGPVLSRGRASVANRVIAYGGPHTAQVGRRLLGLASQGAPPPAPVGGSAPATAHGPPPFGFPLAAPPHGDYRAHAPAPSPGPSQVGHFYGAPVGGPRPGRYPSGSAPPAHTPPASFGSGTIPGPPLGGRPHGGLRRGGGPSHGGYGAPASQGSRGLRGRRRGC